MEYIIDPKKVNLQDAAGMQLVELLRDIIDAIPSGASEEEIAEAVDAWINAHPAAIGTVPNGSITKPKLSADLSTEITKNTEDIADLKNEVDHMSTSLSDRAIQLLDTILSAAVYTSDQSANIEALIEELSSGGNVDNIIVADGVMTILGLANTPTASGGILTIT